MLEYLKNVKLTRSAVSFIVGAIVILLFLKQCNSIENLKNEKELAQKEAKRAMNNLLAEQDSVRVLIKENGGIVASKRTFEYTIAELQSNNKDLVSEYKEALGDIKNLKDVNSLLKTEIAVISNVKSEPSVITQSSDTTATIAFEKLDENRAFFSKMNAVQLKNELFKKDKYFTQFKEYITSNGLLFNISNQKEQVLTYLYAEFSKQLINDTSYYQIVLPKDKMITKVLEKQR